MEAKKASKNMRILPFMRRNREKRGEIWRKGSKLFPFADNSDDGNGREGVVGYNLQAGINHVA